MIRRMPSLGRAAENLQSKLIASFKRRRAGSQGKTRYVCDIPYAHVALSYNFISAWIDTPL
jgi:hypothetical protein